MKANIIPITGISAFPIGFIDLITTAAKAVIVTVRGPYITERFNTISLESYTIPYSLSPIGSVLLSIYINKLNSRPCTS